MSESKDRALEQFLKADKAVQDLILAEAEKRVQSNISRSDALNQRLSALCALLFAGAAVAATYTTNADRVSPLSIGVACAASVVFAVGGAIGCAGLFSRKRGFPGEKPSWWISGEDVSDLSELSELHAKGWLVSHREEVIDDLAAGVAWRALCFNSAVIVGAVAGGLISVAAVVGAVIGPIKKPLPEPTFISFECVAKSAEAKPVASPETMPAAKLTSDMLSPETSKASCALLVRSAGSTP